MKLSRMVAAWLATLAAVIAILGQTKQPQDEEYARLVKEWTTKPEFMSPLVDHLPKAAGVPSPKDVLGYHVGAPKKLTYTAGIAKYYQALAAASPRVRILPAGRTDEGKEQLVVAVSSEYNIRTLEADRGDLAKLADPRGLDESEARRIIARAKPIYMFTASQSHQAHS